LKPPKEGFRVQLPVYRDNNRIWGKLCAIKLYCQTLCNKTLLPQVLQLIIVGAVNFMLMDCLRLVLAFDVLPLGTAIMLPL